MIIPFDYIFFGAYLYKKIEKPYSFVLISLILILEIIMLTYYFYKRIYYFELNQENIIIKYKVTNVEKKYEFNKLKEVVIFNSQNNSMHNINFYFNDKTKISMPTSEKDDLKKVYRFFKDKQVECKVLGLPAGRAPEDYGW